MSDCCNSKETGKNVESRGDLICFCFQHSKSELKEAVSLGREQEIIDDIKAKIKDPGCSCETLNPSGRCCLGDINALIKQQKSL